MIDFKRKMRLYKLSILILVVVLLVVIAFVGPYFQIRREPVTESAEFLSIILTAQPITFTKLF